MIETYTKNYFKIANLIETSQNLILEDKRGQIVTFYSYKGGVGRTRALANVAYQLAALGRKVLCIDFDLEAPGLSCYFDKWINRDQTNRHDGVIDLFYSYKTFVLSKNPFAEILNIEKLIQKVVVRAGQKPFDLDFIGPGKQDSKYGQKVTDFDWASFYDYWEGGRFIEHLRTQLLNKYDYILIDSRTGVSDIGGICTIQLPTILVGVFTSFRQSMVNLERMIKIILKQRVRLGRNESLAVIPLPSRIERNVESDKYDEWFLELENSYLAETISSSLFPWQDKKEVLLDIMLQYFPIFSYKDDLESECQDITDKTANAWRYRNLVALLEKHFTKGHIDFDEFDRISLDSFSENIKSYYPNRETTPEISVISQWLQGLSEVKYHSLEK